MTAQAALQYATAAFAAFGGVVGVMSLLDRAAQAYKDYAATTPSPDDDVRAARLAGYLDLAHRIVAVLSVKGTAGK